MTRRRLRERKSTTQTVILFLSLNQASPANLHLIRGHHYIGTWLRNLRKNPGVEQGNPTNAWGVGQLEDLQSTLSRVPNLWAAALIPPDWQAPEGVPEVWTRLLELEILPAIAAEEERKRNAEERRRALTQWREENKRAELAYRRGESTEKFTDTEDIHFLQAPLADFLCDQWRADDYTGARMATRLKTLGLCTIGQLIQLTDEEIAYLFKQACDEEFISDTWWKRSLREWLYENGRLLRPVILADELHQEHPIPQAVLQRREERAAVMTHGVWTQGDQHMLTHFDALRVRLDDIEISVRTANCLQNLGVEYIWQLCQWTEARLLKTRNFGRKSLIEIRDILAELGLELGLTFSQKSINLLKAP